MMQRRPQAMVLRTAGTNCDGETLHALCLAGAEATLVHINDLWREPGRLGRCHLLVIPGGFSYGDDIAAGKILANELRYKLGTTLQAFVASGRRVIGICNGFQVLVKAGFLPGFDGIDTEPLATLGANDSGRFQCEWVTLRRGPSAAEWLASLPPTFELPIAHGEGKFIPRDQAVLRRLIRNRQIVFRYHRRNPNGSVAGIAALCNPQGNVIGIMPHPERHVTRYQHPTWTRDHQSEEAVGMAFFRAAVNFSNGRGRGAGAPDLPPPRNAPSCPPTPPSPKLMRN